MPTTSLIFRWSALAALAILSPAVVHAQRFAPHIVDTRARASMVPTTVLHPTSSRLRAAASVHRAVAGAAGYEANAWWIETADGLILIDALMLRRDARALVAALRATDKPLRAVVITHPHADHFGGLPMIRAAFPGVQVLATAATAAAMRTVHNEGMVPNGWLRALGSEYDTSFVAPDRIVASGDTLRLAGLTVMLRDYGPFESDNNSVVWVPELKALFTGDATVHGASVYVGTQDARLALRALPRLLADHPGEVTAYSGHYGPRPLARMVAENLEQVRGMLGAAHLIGGDTAARTPDGNFTLAARRQLLSLLVLHTAGTGDYGIGALGMARFELPALVAAVRADSARRAPAQTEAVRAAMRPLLFLLGEYELGGVTLGLGGLYIDAKITAPSGQRYQLQLSYDQAQARYRVVSRDEVSGLIDVFEGLREADGALVVSNVGPGTHYLDASGAKVFNRMRFAPQADGTWIWLVETGAGDGVWGQPYEVVMRRRPIS